MTTNRELEDIRERALISLQVDYKMWLRYGDMPDRMAARNAAWILTGRVFHPVQLMEVKTG